MDWTELFEEAGLSDREAKSLVILSSSKELKASDLAKKLGTNRLDAYNSLSRLTQIGLVNVTADRPMKFSCSSLPVLFKRLIKDQKSRIKNYINDINEKVERHNMSKEIIME